MIFKVVMRNNFLKIATIILFFALTSCSQSKTVNTKNCTGWYSLSFEGYLKQLIDLTRKVEGDQVDPISIELTRTVTRLVKDYLIDVPGLSSQIKHETIVSYISIRDEKYTIFVVVNGILIKQKARSMLSDSVCFTLNRYYDILGEPPNGVE